MMIAFEDCAGHLLDSDCACINRRNVKDFLSPVRAPLRLNCSLLVQEKKV